MIPYSVYEDYVYDDYAYEDYAYEDLDDDPYEEIRELLAPEFMDLHPDNIEDVLWQVLGDISPEELEGFWSTLKNIGKKVTPIAKSVLPVAAPIVGGVIGGPVGASLGGLVGKAAGQLLSPSQPRPAAPRPLPQAAQGTSIGHTGALPTGGSPATAQLLQTILNPKVLQGLMSMLMGQAGKQTVPVGNTSIPPSAFANLVGVLANRAAAEYNAFITPMGDGVPRYLLDISGEFVVDPADPEARAGVLLALLEQTTPELWEYDEDWYDDEETWEPVWCDEYEDWEDDDLYDVIDEFEIFLDEMWGY